MFKIDLPHKTKFRVSDAMVTERGVKIPIIEGILSESEVVSPNGYRYRASFWPKVLSESYVKDMIRNKECLGCIEHPESDSDYLRTPYDKASHIVLSVELEGNNPKGKFGLLNNEAGNAIKALVDVGVPVGVSTRGMGEEGRDEVSAYIDEDQYALITWDIVKAPNFGDLKMVKVSDSIVNNPFYHELKEAYHLRDSVAVDYNAKSLAGDINGLIAELRALFKKYQII